MPEFAIQRKNHTFEIKRLNMVSTLNDAQRTLLELLAEPLSAKDMEQLRTLLVQFRYRRLQNMINGKWEEENWTQATLDKWYMEHNRTSYHKPARQ
ncbi:MAG: hypothetical protein MUC59_01900 [Saprospiraceae bacterium]|jgi:hypothetical protein|nr:hypothetical protein [Saprospiraceae bacterium]